MCDAGELFHSKRSRRKYNCYAPQLKILYWKHSKLFPCGLLEILSIWCVRLTCRSMTCRSMTCRSMTCRSMTCRSMTCRSITCRSITCRSITCRSITCRSMACRSMTCRAMACRAMTRRSMTRRSMTRRSMACHSMTCRAMTCRSMTCRSMTCRSMTCRSMTCRSMTRHSMTCRSMTCCQQCVLWLHGVCSKTHSSSYHRVGQLPFASISSVPDWWTWLQTDFIDTVYWDQWYNGQATTSAQKVLCFQIKGFIDKNFLILSFPLFK